MIITNQQILLNGRYHSQNGAVINLNNRAFLYGDTISESLHACAGRLCFFEEHIENLIAAMKIAGMDIPEKFTTGRDGFREEISKMLVKNKVFKGATVRIIVFRGESDGFYPANDGVEYAVTIDVLPQTGFDFNREGLWISVYDEFKKYPSPFWNFDTHENSLLKLRAMKSMPVNEKVDDVILLNHNGNWAESVICGTIFLLKDKVVYTPPLSEGARDSVFRRKVIQVLKDAGYQVETEKPVTQEFAAKAEEIFLGSVSTGIRWVGAYKRRRFYRTLGLQTANAINLLYQNAE